MTTPDSAIRDALRTYMNANSYHPDKLKRQLTERADDPENVLIRDGLREAIDSSSIQPTAFEGLTNSLADTQEEVNEWMQALWAYIYEDGPEPDDE